MEAVPKAGLKGEEASLLLLTAPAEVYQEAVGGSVRSEITGAGWGGRIGLAKWTSSVRHPQISSTLLHESSP